jgi:hypothetical protein
MTNEHPITPPRELVEKCPDAWITADIYEVQRALGRPSTDPYSP